jgi:hypothetical protein
MSVLLDEILKEFKKLNETMGDLAISIKALIVGTVLQKENEALEVVKEVEITPKIVKESPGFKTVSTKAEYIQVMEVNGRKYKKFVPCKYKCGLWSAWPIDYKSGDKRLHINPITKEPVSLGCGDYAEEIT